MYAHKGASLKFVKNVVNLKNLTVRTSIKYSNNDIYIYKYVCVFKYFL